jgi:hypothetical protein
MPQECMCGGSCDCGAWTAWGAVRVCAVSHVARLWVSCDNIIASRFAEYGGGLAASILVQQGLGCTDTVGSCVQQWDWGATGAAGYACRAPHVEPCQSSVLHCRRGDSDITPCTAAGRVCSRRRPRCQCQTGEVDMCTTANYLKRSHLLSHRRQHFAFSSFVFSSV